METERIDTRRLDPAARERLRKTVMRMHKRGHSQASIAFELGLRRPTVTHWIGKEKSGGGTREGRRGRPLGDGRTLTPEQEDRIRKDIVDKTPDQMKLRFALWNAQNVRAYIKQSFLIDVPIRSVRRYLNRWGFTPQRPLKRAFSRDPKRLRSGWKATTLRSLLEPNLRAPRFIGGMKRRSRLSNITLGGMPRKDRRPYWCFRKASVNVSI